MALNIPTADQLLAKIKNAKNQLVQVTSGALGSADEFVRKNPVTSTATIAGGALLGGTIVQIARKKSKKSNKTKTKSKAKSSKKKKSKRKSSAKKRKSKQRKPYTAGKGKDRSTRRIRFTKNNQPYVILKSGKARFIKKSSVARARKLKGGRY